MNEVLILETSEPTLQEYTNVIARAGVFLQMGYGCVDIETLEDGNTHIELAFAYDSVDKIGFGEKQDKSDKPVQPNIGNPVVPMIDPATIAVGDLEEEMIPEGEGEEEYPEESEYDDRVNLKLKIGKPKGLQMRFISRMKG